MHSKKSRMTDSLSWWQKAFNFSSQVLFACQVFWNLVRFTYLQYFKTSLKKSMISAAGFICHECEHACELCMVNIRQYHKCTQTIMPISQVVCRCDQVKPISKLDSPFQLWRPQWNHKPHKVQVCNWACDPVYCEMGVAYRVPPFITHGLSAA